MSKAPIVAIVGQANVGKSSLFNAVLGRREAIVAKEAGTTRDSISAKASVGDHDFWLVDTAGMKNPEDDFELTIQEQINEAIASADVIWVVVEAGAMLTDSDRRVAKAALKSQKPVILVVNKIDQVKDFDWQPYARLGIKQIVGTSTKQGRGIEQLLDRLISLLPKATIKLDDQRIRVALLGRPNVGKSSLFNSLAKKQQAVVADFAGTTRDVNRAIVRYQKQEIELMDTAGIRRPGKIGKGIEHFSVLRALSAIENSDICFLLIDVNEINVVLDQKIAGMAKEAGKGLVIVVSKWDVAEGKDAYTRDALAPVVAANFDFVPWAPLVFTSSVTGQNVTKLFDLILEVKANREKRIATTELNKWLRQAIDSHPPAGLKNRSPKLNYIVQETDNPTPAFKIFGSHTKFLHWSYKRYLERLMRSSFGFEGTALQLWFIEKHQAHKHGNSPTKPERTNDRRKGKY